MVCLVEDELTSSDACEVLDGYKLARDFREAMSNSDAAHRVEVLVLAENAKKFLVIGFPKEWSLDRKMDIVTAIYAEQARLIAAVQKQIVRTMTEDPGVSRRLNQYAHLDSQGVQSMVSRAHGEQRENTSRAEHYLDNHPESSGVSFNCALSCHQAIAAGHGLNVFDTK